MKELITYLLLNSPYTEGELNDLTNDEIVRLGEIYNYKAIPTVYPTGKDGLRYVSEEVGYVDQDEEYY